MASMKTTNQDDGRQRNRKKDMLKMFYGVEEKQMDHNDPLNVDSSSFNSDMFLQKLKHEKSLAELMDCENDMAKQIRKLDSDMQTLVYENYNKFISATDTIRTMKRDFRQMEDQMAKLTSNMSTITQLNSSINTSMSENRQKIEKLSGMHSVLNKLQNLFELPIKLKKYLEVGSYDAAVTEYIRNKSVIQRYRDMESFSGINKDCLFFINEIIKKLKQTFHNKDSSSHQLGECVALLLKLDEPADMLCDDYLQHSRKKLDDNLHELEGYLVEESDKGFLSIDMLEFVDRGCNGFLSNLALTIASYDKLFIKNDHRHRSKTHNQQYQQFEHQQNDVRELAAKKLDRFVKELLDMYLNVMERRMMMGRRTQDNALVVKSLDRFYRRLQATRNLIPESDMMKCGEMIVVRVTKARCNHFSMTLKEYFADCLSDARNAMTSSLGVRSQAIDLLEIVNTTASSLLNQVKSTLADIQLFTISDNNFSNISYFQTEFSWKDVREDIIVDFIMHINSVMLSICSDLYEQAELTLMLSRLCRDLEQSTVEYILTLTDEQFHISTRNKKSSLTEIRNELGRTSQRLIECYVRRCSDEISRMIRTSFLTRSWIESPEPRQVRAVMRRVVEDVTTTDTLVGSLYEEGMRKAAASTSDTSGHKYHGASRQQRHASSHWAAYPPSSSNLDNSLLSNIQKLFSERIDVFSPVDFTRTSIVSGVVKLVIKTILECVRLSTLNKYGLQQLQVDCHYLQMYLWRFVADEKIIDGLLDEVLTSCVNRCVDVCFMEQSVIDVICQRG